MAIVRFVAFGLLFIGVSRIAAGQGKPPEPPPLWEVQVGAAFVGTSGNTDTSTVGADFALRRRWPDWQIASVASAVRTTDSGESTAERYLAAIRGQRRITTVIGLSAGELVERDRLSGIDLRSIFDVGLSWALVRRPVWTLDATTGIGWKHERALIDPALDRPIGVIEAASRVALGPGAETRQRLTIYPDFKESSDYRSEAELSAQAAMNSRLALKVGYLWRYSNTPVAGFSKTDNTATASLVLRWRAANVLSP